MGCRVKQECDCRFAQDDIFFRGKRAYQYHGSRFAGSGGNFREAISSGGVAISALISAFWWVAEILVLITIGQGRLSFFKGKLPDGTGMDYRLDESTILIPEFY